LVADQPVAVDASVQSSDAIASSMPSTLTIKPNRPISDLRFTLTARSVKVNLRSEIGRFGLYREGWLWFQRLEYDFTPMSQDASSSSSTSLLTSDDTREAHSFFESDQY